MRVLVTGGAGYIGSHTAKRLACAGHEVVVFDNLRRGNRWAVKWGPLVEGDLLDDSALESAFAGFRFDAVFHFAALAYVGESMRRPDDYFRNNVQGTLNLLRAMRKAGVSTLVFSSTCAIFGQPEALPITEETPQQPCNPYGESKKAVEQILRWEGECHGLRWAALRYFNAAGCDPGGEIGESHEPETHLLPCLLRSVMDPREPFRLFGSDYPTPDGTCIRDYVHVNDLAEAHLRAWDYLRDGGRSGGFNLGTGQGYSIRQIIEKVEEVTGIGVPVEPAPRRAGDPAELVASPRLARERLGWTPRDSSLDEIVRTAWAWETSHTAAVARA